MHDFWSYVPRILLMASQFPTIWKNMNVTGDHHPISIYLGGQVLLLAHHAITLSYQGYSLESWKEWGCAQVWSYVYFDGRCQQPDTEWRTITGITHWQNWPKNEEHMAHVHYLFNIFGISSDRAAGWEPHLGPVQLPCAMLRLISVSVILSMAQERSRAHDMPGSALLFQHSVSQN